MTTVVNINRETYDEYCGRGSIWGNPFVIGKDGDRVQVIERYRGWFGFLVKDPRVRHFLYKLKDKKLGCFCSPLPCHCQIISDWVNENCE